MGLSLIFLKFHPYMMTLGVTMVYAGMFLRLFFPAKKYFYLQLGSLISFLIPLPPFQVVGSLLLLTCEVWGLNDVMSYGSRFPRNYLVLSSPLLLAISWALYLVSGSLNYVLISVLVYLLGVNIGVLAASSSSKPRFGIQQIPVFISLLPAIFSIRLTFITILLYYAWIKPAKFSLPVYSLFFTNLLSLTVGSVFGNSTHGFTLGLMLPLFMNCMVFSINRGNYQKLWVPITMLFISFLMRFVNVELSALPATAGVIYFLFLIRDIFSYSYLRSGRKSK